MIKRLILRLLALSPLLKSRPISNTPLENANSVLFICFSPHLGSVMCTTPILGCIKLAKPNIKIGVVCDEFNSMIYEHSPYIDELLAVPNPQRSFFHACFSLCKLRSQLKNYEWIVADSANSRNINLIPMLLAGIGNIAGFGDSNSLMNHKLPFPAQGTSAIGGNLALLKAFAIEHNRSGIEPELFWSIDDEAGAERFFARNGIETGQTIVAMQTQSKDNKPNRWRESRFAELADRMVSELGITVVFTGSSREIESIERIRGLMAQPSYTSAGQTTIRQLAALLQRCRLFVTLDTGPMHVGRAVGVPMVILASAYQSPAIWLPIDKPNCTILRKGDIACALCYNDFCTTMECMDAISVDEAFETIRRQLAKQHLQ